MRFLQLPTHRLHYRIDGSAGPWVLLCNSLGTDLRMWDGQVSALSARHRVLRYDCRGHGESTAPPAPYDLADLGRDALDLLDALGIERAHFCGLSLGGLTGQWLGIYAAERFNRLVLCATAAKIGTAEGWQGRIGQVRAEGLQGLTQATADRWFTPEFNFAHADVVREVLGQLTATSAEGYIGCCHALGGADLRAQLGRIRQPVLAISGSDDPVTTPSDLQVIADGVEQGRHVSLPGRHIVNIESAPEFNARLAAFLAV